MVCLTIFLISSYSDKFLSSLARHRPALFETNDRAAENRMFGSLSFYDVPKSEYR